MKTRRKIIKGVIGTGLVSGALPNSWMKPVVNAVVLPVHAETSSATTSSPVISAIADATINDNGGAIPTTVATISGIDIQTGAVFSIVADPTNGFLTLDSATGVLTWNGNLRSNQSYSIIVKVTNSDSGFDTESFTLNVNNNI